MTPEAPEAPCVFVVTRRKVVGNVNKLACVACAGTFWVEPPAYYPWLHHPYASFWNGWLCLSCNADHARLRQAMVREVDRRVLQASEAQTFVENVVVDEGEGGSAVMNLDPIHGDENLGLECAKYLELCDEHGYSQSKGDEAVVFIREQALAVLDYGRSTRLDAMARQISEQRAEHVKQRAEIRELIHQVEDLHDAIQRSRVHFAWHCLPTGKPN